MIKWLCILIPKGRESEGGLWGDVVRLQPEQTGTRAGRGSTERCGKPWDCRPRAPLFQAGGRWLCLPHSAIKTSAQGMCCGSGRKFISLLVPDTHRPLHGCNLGPAQPIVRGLLLVPLHPAFQGVE